MSHSALTSSAARWTALALFIALSAVITAVIVIRDHRRRKHAADRPQTRAERNAK